MSNSLSIPLINPSSISSKNLRDLMDIGFCYVPLPESLLETIKTSVQVARQFFQTDSEGKITYKLQDKVTRGERYQGYVVRSQSANTNAIEQFFFNPLTPFGIYENYSAQIKHINDYFSQAIFLPLMQALFKQLKFSDTDFTEATHEPRRYLVFQRYLATGEHKTAIRLNQHKDFGLLTVVFFEESGLEVLHEKEWIGILPKANHAVVNVGNALELMSGGQCHSAIHRVINTTDNRMSMVYFFNANYQQPLKNYVNNDTLFPSGEVFFKQQAVEYYQADR